MKKLILLIILFPSVLFGATLYVDGTCNAGAAYDVATRTQGSGSATSYQTVQAAITACSPGDTIYMRAGTYQEIDIDLPVGSNGTAGNHTTLASYPGEWAIIDATGLGVGDGIWGETVLTTDTASYGKYNSTRLTEYWTFERFEVTGGRCGFFIKGGDCTFRYLYIHDNGRNSGDQLMGGMVFGHCAELMTIEYCRFADNGNPVSVTNNSNHILIEADYREDDDDLPDGLEFVPTNSINRNVIRYNYFSGVRAQTAIQHKNQQRFGWNDRNPDPAGADLAAYKTWGDDIHHNIFLGSAYSSAVLNQDCVQFHNNILDKGVFITGFEFPDDTSAGSTPITYDACVYNNTIVTSTQCGIGQGSGVSKHGIGKSNYYDSGENKTVRPWVWIYNNIIGPCVNGSSLHVPFVVANDMPQDEASNYSDSYANLTVNRNLLYKVVSSYIAIVGRKITDYTGCDYYRHSTVADLNTCLDTWGSLTPGTSKNWASSTDGLFGGSGAALYIASGTFDVDGEAGALTIATGGIGGAHPYLSTTLPSYVGAVNPSDSAWVAGVLALDAAYMTSATAGASPSWVEGTRPHWGGSGVGVNR